jgi:hypothetical protein
MKHVRRFVVVLAALVLSACAATNIQRAQQLGALGKAYSDAVSAAGDEAMASTTTFSLDEIRQERRGGAFATPGDREKAINDEIDRLRKRQMLVDESNAQVALLGEYFSTSSNSRSRTSPEKCRPRPRVSPTASTSSALRSRTIRKRKRG